MDNHQYQPLEFKDKEPFLRLEKHKNIILTPPRPDDPPAFVPPMNDPRVYECLSTPPFPYTLEHGEGFVNGLLKDYKEVCKKLDGAKDIPESIMVDYCPVRVIREVQENGSDILIGDIGFFKWRHGELMAFDGTVDWTLKEKNEEEMAKLPIGDPKIVWALGDFLMPSHHNRGIMTDVVDTLLKKWGIPRMGIRHLCVDVFTDNEASAKVFLKNGFKSVGTFPDHVVSRGKKRGLNVLEWKYEDQ
ncbi:hypothetical protein CPB83DRAFT_848308 [Crepidotus variabilis]|uniref:N-acetyltransferase domain-containing protein n=1 Tax=Crepidotus variabilis TaxID=179855 RepID=A0A9P6JT88_9AGAR|nr:hypothetical protein CPB83DRAFT_848308 [Crepidotus variabilis]